MWLWVSCRSWLFVVGSPRLFSTPFVSGRVGPSLLLFPYGGRRGCCCPHSRWQWEGGCDARAGRRGGRSVSRGGRLRRPRGQRAPSRDVCPWCLCPFPEPLLPTLRPRCWRPAVVWGGGVTSPPGEGIGCWPGPVHAAPSLAAKLEDGEVWRA